jgi:hypothetical protein
VEVEFESSCDSRNSETNKASSNEKQSLDDKHCNHNHDLEDKIDNIYRDDSEEEV